MKKLLAMSLACAALLAFTACSSGETPGNPPRDYPCVCAEQCKCGVAKNCGATGCVCTAGNPCSKKKCPSS